MFFILFWCVFLCLYVELRCELNHWRYFINSSLKIYSAYGFWSCQKCWWNCCASTQEHFSIIYWMKLDLWSRNEMFFVCVNADRMRIRIIDRLNGKIDKIMYGIRKIVIRKFVDIENKKIFQNGLKFVITMG